MIDDKYEYFAFISYKEEDSEWAIWLQHKLENYNFPITMRKENPSLPKRISPIYEYKSEAGGGRLKEVIWKGLTRSKYLIVICSPRAIQSKWLNDGIRYFIESGQEENIIPFIVEGKPKSSNPEEECFPSTLLELKGERELRGININEMGRDAAAVKVVSQMFDLKFDNLWQRWEREQKKQRRRKIVSIVGGVSILAMASIIFAFIVSDKNAQLEKANVEILQERDKVEKANTLLLIANDSITETNKRLDKSNSSLELANHRLKNANETILKNNWDLKVSNAKTLSKMAQASLGNGNYLEAKKSLLQICTDKDAGKLAAIPEVEFALRTLYRENQKDGFKGRFVLDNIGGISLARISGDGNSLYVLLNDTCLVNYDVRTGKSHGIISNLSLKNTSDVTFHDFDVNTGNLYYTTDSVIYVKNMFKVSEQPLSIKTSNEIDDFVVSPTFEVCAYSFRSGEYPKIKSEWHIINLMDSTDYIVERCGEIYAFSPSGSQILAEINDEYCLYDIKNKVINKVIDCNKSIGNAHFTSDGKNIIIEGYNNSDKLLKSSIVDVFNIPSNGFIDFGNIINIEGEVQENPQCNRIVTGNYDGTINIYDVKMLPFYDIVKDEARVSGRRIDSLNSHSEDIKSIQFSNDGTKMMSISNGKICIWDVKVEDFMKSILIGYNYIASSGSRCIKEKYGYAELIEASSKETIGIPLFKVDADYNNRHKYELISRTNEVVVTTKDSLIYILNPISEQCFSIPYHCNKYSLRLSLNKDGSRIAIYDSFKSRFKQMLSIYDILNQSLVAKKDSLWCSSMNLSPIGDEIVIATGHEICIYNANNFKRRIVFDKVHYGYINTVCYSHDGRYVVSAGWDRNVCLWDSKSGKIIRVFHGAEKNILSCSMSSDNRYIIATTESDDVLEYKSYIWNTDSGQIVEIIESGKLSFCQDVKNKMYGYGGEDSNGAYRFYNFPTLETIIKELQEQ